MRRRACAVLLVTLAWRGGIGGGYGGAATTWRARAHDRRGYDTSGIKDPGELVCSLALLVIPVAASNMDAKAFAEWGFGALSFWGRSS